MTIDLAPDLLALDPIDVLLLPALQLGSATLGSLHGFAVNWSESDEELLVGLEEGDSAAQLGMSLLRPTRKVQFGFTAVDGTSGVMTLLGTDELLVAALPSSTGGIHCYATSSLRGCAELMARQLTGDWTKSAAPEALTAEAWWSTTKLDGHRVVGAASCAFQGSSEDELTLKHPQNTDGPADVFLEDLASWLVDLSTEPGAPARTTEVTQAAADPLLGEVVPLIRELRTLMFVIATADHVTAIESGPAGTVRFGVDNDQPIDCTISSRGAIGELIDTLYGLAPTGAVFALSAEFGGHTSTWDVDEDDGDWVLSGPGDEERRGRDVDGLVAAVVKSVAARMAQSLPSPTRPER